MSSRTSTFRDADARELPTSSEDGHPETERGAFEDGQRTLTPLGISLLEAFSACDAVSGGLDGMRRHTIDSPTHLRRHICGDTESPRQCPDTSTLMAVGSSKLARAVRGLYDDADSLQKKAWLLQPVLHSGTSSSSREQRPFSAGRSGGGPPLPRAASAGRRRLPSRPVSARDAAAPDINRPVSAKGNPADHRGEPPLLGRVEIGPVLGSETTPSQRAREREERARPWSARPQSSSGAPRESRAQGPLTAPQRAAAQTLELLTGMDEREEDLRRVKQAKIREWLHRKDTELSKRRRAEEEEARQNDEEAEQRQRQRLAREAEEERRKLSRLRTAARRKQELAFQVERAHAGGAERTPREKAALTEALAAYARPRTWSAGIVRAR